MAPVEAVSRPMPASPVMISAVLFSTWSLHHMSEDAHTQIAGVPLPSAALNKSAVAGAVSQPDRHSSVREYLGLHPATYQIGLLLHHVIVSVPALIKLAHLVCSMWHLRSCMLVLTINIPYTFLSTICDTDTACPLQHVTNSCCNLFDPEGIPHVTEAG